MPSNDIPHFTRDPSLSSSIADQFGSGAAQAEQLITASQLRYSPELNAANLLTADAEHDYSDKDIAKAAELEDEQFIPGSGTVRGRYLTYLFEMPDGRVGKDALLIEDGKLVAPDRPDTPERAALRAQVSANSKVRAAQDEAAQIIEDAKAEAAKLMADAAEKVEAERTKQAEKDAKAIDKQAEKDAKDGDPQAQANARQGGKGVGNNS